MKTTKLNKTRIIWAFAITAVLLCISYTRDANAQVFTRPTLPVSNTSSLQSPDAIANFLWKNFRFEEDQVNFGKAEYWQSPEEFMTNKAGDCEDFAVMAKELLTSIGKKAFILNVYGKKFAHTVCVFVDNGKYQIIDMTEVKIYNASSLEELMSKIYPHWETGAIVQMSKSTKQGRILKKIEKKAKGHHTFGLSV